MLRMKRSRYSELIMKAVGGFALSLRAPQLALMAMLSGSVLKYT
jgi:hypothetical protein